MQRFSQVVSKLSAVERRGEYVSEGYLLTLGRFISMFANLDELKNIKASIKNDYAQFKRYISS